MKLICKFSRINDFKVGVTYTAKTRDYWGRPERMIEGQHQVWTLNNCGLDVKGCGDEPFASFARVRSFRKMLVRAFRIAARDRGWGDSKNGPCRTWNGSGFKSANDWARWMVSGYDLDEVEEGILYDYADGSRIQQVDVNDWVEEEISCW